MEKKDLLKAKCMDAKRDMAKDGGIVGLTALTQDGRTGASSDSPRSRRTVGLFGLTQDGCSLTALTQDGRVVHAGR